MTTGGFRSGLVAKLKETRTKFLMWLLLPREVRAALAEAKGGRSNPLSAKLVTDAFIKMAGKPVGTIQDYMESLSTKKAGDEIEVVVKRDGKDVSLKVTLGNRPGN